ncbi:hypothetical protein N2152v2_001506 [Parachlorella kessleri]
MTTQQRRSSDGARLHGSAAWSATKEDALSSGKAPTSTPPDDPQEFSRFADLYLGGIWNKVESGLRQLEGESFDYNVEMEGGKFRLMLPDRAEIQIRKDQDRCALVVHSNMHDFHGSYDQDNEVAFKLKNGHFEADGEPLYAYLEDGLAKHLKVQLDLEPESDNTYGPDPT